VKSFVFMLKHSHNVRRQQSASKTDKNEERSIVSHMRRRRELLDGFVEFGAHEVHLESRSSTRLRKRYSIL
jgi:hypothetical protein